MSEPKFTKGPWTANFNDYTKPYVAILNEDNVVIAQIPDGEVIRGDTTILGIENIEANINLIASAPDMYEALETIERVAGIGMMEDDPARVKARDALRKARGEEE